MLKVHWNSISVSSEIQQAKSRVPVTAVFVVALYNTFGLPKPKLQLSIAKEMLTKASWHGSASVKVQSCKMRQLTLGNTGVKKRKHGWWNDFRQVLSWRGLIEVHPAELLLFKPQYVHMSVQSSGKTELCRLRGWCIPTPQAHTHAGIQTHTLDIAAVCVLT